MPVIYKIVNPKGKIYIGQSWDFKKRMYDYNIINCKQQPKLYKSFIKYGVENHIFKIVCELPNDVEQSILDMYERIYWQAYTDCNVEMINLKEPGLGGRHSQETIEKMSRTKKENISPNIKLFKSGKDHPTYGKGFSKKHKKNLVESIGRKIINNETGQIYESITSASLAYSIKYQKLYFMLKHINKNKTNLKFL